MRATHCNPSTDSSSSSKLDIRYISSVLAQVALPHRDPGGVREWRRHAGKVAIVIEADGEFAGIPYGTIPRLILIRLISDVVRTKSPEIDLGSSMTQFFGGLGMSPTWGSNRSVSRLLDQMRRLFLSRITLEDNRPGRLSMRDMQIVPDFVPRSDSSLCSHLVLSNDFVQHALKAPVPINMEIIRQISRSPLTLDLYIWLTYRAFRLREWTAVPWSKLAEQFGGSYHRLRDFRHAVQSCLADLKLIYSANVTVTGTGLLLGPSSPSVPPRGSQT